MKTKISKFPILAGLLTIIVLALAACQPSVAIKEKVSQGLALIYETSEQYTTLPVNLVNLGVEKLPRSEPLSLTEQLLSSGSRYAYVRGDLVNVKPEKASSAEGVISLMLSESVSMYMDEIPESMHPDNLPEWVERRIELSKLSYGEMMKSAGSAVGISSGFLPEWVRVRVEVAEKSNREMLQAASEVVGIPSEFLPEWVRLRLEVVEGASSEMMQSAIPDEFLPEWVKQRVEISEKFNLAMLQAASGVASIPPEFISELVRLRAEAFNEEESEMMQVTINLVNLGQEILPRTEAFSLTEMILSSGSRYAYIRSDMVSPVADTISVAESRPSYLPSGLVNLRTEDLPLEEGELLPCPTATC
jgi:hypothetical protein